MTTKASACAATAGSCGELSSSEGNVLESLPSESRDAYLSPGLHTPAANRASRFARGILASSLSLSKASSPKCPDGKEARTLPARSPSVGLVGHRIHLRSPTAKRRDFPSREAISRHRTFLGELNCSPGPNHPRCGALRLPWPVVEILHCRTKATEAGESRRTPTQPNTTVLLGHPLVYPGIRSFSS